MPLPREALLIDRALPGGGAEPERMAETRAEPERVTETRAEPERMTDGSAPESLAIRVLLAFAHT